MFYATFIILGAMWVIAVYFAMRSTFGNDAKDQQHPH